MAKSDPTKDPGFQRTLRNLLTAPPKRQADMKIGKKSGTSAKRPKRKKAKKNPAD
jgi:hypothetical protein